MDKLIQELHETNLKLREYLHESDKQFEALMHITDNILNDYALLKQKYLQLLETTGHNRNPEDAYREDFSAEENPYAKKYNNTWGPV